jgi:hypothetical protein
VEHANEHLVAARVRVRVQQNDFVGLAPVDLARMAQPDPALGLAVAVLLSHAGLAHNEGLEPFTAPFLQDGCGRDVAVSLPEAFMWGHGPHLVIRQREFRAQPRGSSPVASMEIRQKHSQFFLHHWHFLCRWFCIPSLQKIPSPPHWGSPVGTSQRARALINFL